MEYFSGWIASCLAMTKPSYFFISFPPWSFQIVSARLAISESWVIITIVFLVSLWSVSMISIIREAFPSSRFPVGSSARRNGTSATNALAIATRCCSPPESSVGYLCNFPVSHTFSRISLVAYRRGAWEISRTRSMFSSTVRFGMSSNAWNMNAICCPRYSIIASRASWVISVSSRVTFPRSGESIPAIRERRVDLPAPLAPISATKLPWLICQSKLVKSVTVSSREVYDFEMFLSVIIILWE